MMATASTSLLVLLILPVCFSKEVWDGLGVTWQPSSLPFPTRLPRTVTQAEQEAWYKVDTVCAGDKGYLGFAYEQLSVYPAVSLLFDQNGYIAGIQAGIDVDEAKLAGYPTWHQMPPFIKKRDRYILTAYFVNPKDICLKGRTEQEFYSQGTGHDLYFQNGDEVMKMAKKESDVMAPWVKGQCHIGLGRHYWYNIDDKMSCESVFPFFLLYNGGELNGFGFIFTAKLETKFYDHTKELYPLYMEKVPKCLEKRDVSVMHVFMDNYPSLNFC